jgi:hypothetical protein
VAIIAAHNHPSGQLKPSEQDLEATRRLSEAGEVIGICLLDHLIFNKKGYFSFRKEGCFPEDGDSGNDAFTGIKNVASEKPPRIFISENRLHYHLEDKDETGINGIFTGKPRTGKP